MRDIGTMFSAAVKCLDVFTEKQKLVLALMCTFYFRKDVVLLKMNEGNR